MTSLPAPKPLANHACECATSYGAECDCTTQVLWRDPTTEQPAQEQEVISMDRWGNVRLFKWTDPERIEARNTIGWAPIPLKDDV